MAGGKNMPIYKHKGNPEDIQNYRPISLTCVARRLYERILARRMKGYIKQLSDYQGGFRENRSTLQQIFCWNEIHVEGTNRKHVFLDLKAAYDMVNRTILWDYLRYRYRMNHQLLHRLMDLFDANETRIALLGKESLPFQNKRGLLQGSSLSPILFNFFIDKLLRRLDEPSTPKI